MPRALGHGEYDVVHQLLRFPARHTPVRRARLRGVKLEVPLLDEGPLLCPALETLAAVSLDFKVFPTDVAEVRGHPL